MKKFRFLFSLIVPALVLMFAACGNPGDGYTPPPGTTPIPTMTGTVIQTATVTINGKTTTVLTDNKGWTLYYFTPDTATTSACATSPCNTTWPPYVYQGMPNTTSTLPGKVGVQNNANGYQVTYNGHPLYRYSKDTGPGQANGEGVGGKWFVATPDLPVLKGDKTAPAPTPTPTTSYKY